MAPGLVRFAVAMGIVTLLVIAVAIAAEALVRWLRRRK